MFDNMGKRQSKIIRSPLMVAVDFFILAIISLMVGLALHNNYVPWTAAQILGFAIYFGTITIIKIGVFITCRVYGMLTDNFGIQESLKVMFISFISACFGVAAVYLIPADLVPHISPFIALLLIPLEVFLLTSARYVSRVIRVLQARFGHKEKPRRRTLIIGAGSGGKIVIDESRSNFNSQNVIYVIADDDIRKIGGTFSGIPVRGPISNIRQIIAEFRIEEVIIAIANLSKERLHSIIKLLEPCDVKIRRLPLLSEMSSVYEYKVIDINIDELLGRDAIVLHNEDIFKMINGHTVLVTGAGGSIGSELVRQIFAAHPKTLVLFDIYENGVYDIQQELVRKMRLEGISDVKLEVLVGSTYNEKRVESIFRKYRPDYVYHAAAYKHVPLMEDSPMEAMRTNIIGTYYVAKHAEKYEAKKFVLVSTDKAVRPTNVMGATKRFAEMIVSHFANREATTHFAAVRFGNVLGSNGSVVPLFTKQIAEKGPLTVTHPEITRFFMTIPEAVGLILQSSLFSNGGEIFILDMGNPIRILTLAEKMIRQAGYVPYKDIDIVFTGLRPGEKLYEEILVDPKEHKKTANSKIYIEDRCADDVVDQVFPGIIKKLEDDDDVESIKNFLATLVVTYHKPPCK